MHTRIYRLLILVSFVFVFNGLQGFSQNTNPLYVPDSRLYECADKTFLDKLGSEQSELILYYNYYLNNSYEVVSLNQKKPVTGTDIHTVTLKDDNNLTKKYFCEKEFIKGSFNPLKYNFKRNLDGNATYIWKEAGVAIRFIPMRQFQAQFQNFIKENNLNR
jgi:hypothetical protein